jgi:hypothetical protein
MKNDMFSAFYARFMLLAYEVTKGINSHQQAAKTIFFSLVTMRRCD